MIKSTTQTAKSSGLRGCGCGCGENVAGKSIFRPGHDARLASQVSKDLVHGSLEYTNQILDLRLVPATDMQANIDEMHEAMTRKYGPSLARKTFDAAMNVWARTKNAKTKAAKKDVEGTPEGAPKLRIVAQDGDNLATDEGPSIPQITPADPVRVGRWTYPARTNGETLERNTKRDGTGEWVAVQK